jgi:hypothetical protein
MNVHDQQHEAFVTHLLITRIYRGINELSLKMLQRIAETDTFCTKSTPTPKLTSLP